MYTLLVDVDDVLLDWIGGFKKFIESKGVKTTSELPHQWNLGAWIQGQDFVPLVEEFNHSHHFEFLEPHPDAAEVLEKFYRFGFQIHAITSCTDEESAVDRRMNNLDKHFGEVFERVICLPLGGDKFKTLKQFPLGSFWVEDKIQNAIAGLKAGHRAILLDQSHNKSDDHPEIPRCKNWKEVYQRIMDDLLIEKDKILPTLEVSSKKTEVNKEDGDNDQSSSDPGSIQESAPDS